MWAYNATVEAWTEVSGSFAIKAPKYTTGISHPGSRSWSAFAVRKQSVWIYGGKGISEYGNVQNLGDLVYFRYQFTFRTTSFNTLKSAHKWKLVSNSNHGSLHPAVRGLGVVQPVLGAQHSGAIVKKNETLWFFPSSGLEHSKSAG